MAKNPKVQKPAGLVTAKELLARLGIAERTLHSWIAAGMPVSVHGRGGRPSFYDPLDVAAWRLERHKDVDSEGQADLFPDVGNSPALEEFRKQRARQARMAADQMEGRLVDREQVLAIVVDVFTVLRTEFETLERLHGREVGDHVRGVIDRAQESVQKRMADRDAAAAAAIQNKREVADAAG